ncbi:MAG: hypothetical protein LQ351_004992 [Letrouitia transgressa]|nr:MAG: hypothetical protein LQ351_004992 [Letrouitia transgressa]
MSTNDKPTFEVDFITDEIYEHAEWLAVNELAFEWAQSYDTKDWDRLRSILAPTLTVNYGGVNEAQHNSLPADEYVNMMKDPLFLGDSNIDSQHLLGLSKWEKVSETVIIGYHQSRAAHMRWNEGRKTVAAKGHGHGLVTFTYKKIDGIWKWAGITTKVHWNEHEFEKVFIGTAGKK